MNVSCSITPGVDTVELAQLAESLGYQRIWLHDSPALYRDVFMTLALVATHCDDIDLGVGVTVPGLRHPLVAASAIATLEALAPGRIAVGVGSGFTARCMLGQRPVPFQEVEHFVRTLRALLQGDEVEIDGALVQMCHLEGYVPARPLATPIAVAANGPKGIAAARAVGDGVFAMGEPQGDFEWSVFGTAGTVLEDGETLSSPRVFDALGPAVALVYHFTYEVAPAAVDQLPGGPEWRASLESVPVERRHLALHDGHGVAPNERELPFLVPELGGGTFTGSINDLRVRRDELEAAGVTELVYSPMGSDLPRELTAMAEVLLS
jgi:5,10-methylenetetrahydromethanopterin reductase